MRALGIDFGARRIGVAVSEGQIALPVRTLERRGLAKDLEALVRVAREREVDCVVVGLPLRMNGRRGPEAEAAERFAAQVSERLELPVHLMDERLTSVEAERALRDGGRRARDRRGVVDAVAATLILRTWLESRASRPGTREGEPRS
jgi:putative Holliday junction resolvase